MRCTGKVVKIVLILALTVLTLGSTWAVSNPYVSTISSDPKFGTVYSDQVTATVTQIGTTYHYEYVLDFQSSYSSKPLTSFSLGNLGNLLFTAAGNDKGLANPVYGVTSTNSILWSGGNVAVGQPVKFWFDSPYSYTEVSLTAQASRALSGKSLGLTPNVPEPGALVSLAAGVLGIAGAAVRGRSSRK